ncbi:MAG: glycosyltransferase family 39 protein [Chloroflexi bacterium]|nr:glycosyltransferase family 39 protein [Chloroflexota bacterium]
MAHRTRWALEILLPVCLFVASLSVFWGAKAKIDSDEGNWIGTTRYFVAFFVDRDFSQTTWADGYWTRTQPMVFRYVIGSWLWWRGHDLEPLNPHYDFTRGIQANRRLGLAPPDAVLDDARMVTRTMSALAVTMLYLVVRLLGGPVGGVLGGLVAATMATGSPYLQEHLIRAKAESTLVVFLFSAMFCAILSLRRSAPHWPNVWWGILTGLFVGLAFGVKLTTVLVMVAIALWGAAACLDDRFGPWTRRLPSWVGRRIGGVGPQNPEPGTQNRQGLPWIWPTAVLVTTMAVFLASNPFTWANPVQRTWLLFENRRIEMAQQQIDVPSRAVYAVSDRAWLVWDRSVWNDAFGPSRFGKPFEAVLTVIGTVWLAVLAFRSARNGVGPQSVELLVFLWLAILWLGVSLGLGFLLQHYFVPTAVVAIFLSGLAVGWSVQLAWGMGRHLLAGAARSRLPTPTLGKHASA